MAKRDKQKLIPGTEPPSFADLDTAAEEYEGLRDQRQALTPLEVDAKGKLLQLMKKYGLETYEFDGRIVEIVHEEETVKVKRKPGRKKKEGEDEQEES